MAKVNIPTFKLNNGGEIPALGYGTWLGFDDNLEFDISDLSKMTEALSYAIDIGYRHIDTAHFYRIEPEIGQVINKKIEEGTVKRKDVFVTTKVWNHNHREADVELSLKGSLRRLNQEYVDLVLMHWPMAISEEGVDEHIDYLETWRGFESVLTKGLTKAIGVSNFNLDQMKRLLANCKVPPAVNQVEVWNHNHREADVELSLKGSLRRLNQEYVDLVLMHWPMAISEEGVDEHIDYLETWRGFESVLTKGLTKAIGVSNFNLDQMKRLLANCKVPPAVNQVEINLNLGQVELVDFCKDHNVVVVAYSPFGTMVPSRAVPNSPEPKLNNPTLLSVAKKYGKKVSQITLRYLYQRGIASIPKTVTKSRVLENAAIFDFKLEAGDVEKLSAFDVGYRTVRPIFWQHYSNYPFDIVPEKMDEIPLAERKWKNGANLDID